MLKAVNYPVVNMATLNEKVVIQWLRERAKHLTQAADALEGITPQQPEKKETGLPLPGMGAITLAAVKEVVAQKDQRVKTLAKHFSVAEYEVEKIIDAPDSGLERGNRGWITIKK
jgi:hypothetical protein